MSYSSLVLDDLGKAQTVTHYYADLPVPQLLHAILRLHRHAVRISQYRNTLR
jgi:hypothetical protein